MDSQTPPGPGLPTKVVYILGSGRNGSTILGNVLGSAPGLTHVGEVHWIWDRGVGENRPCGCGEPFDCCPFWQAVLADLVAVEPTAGETRAAGRRRALDGFAALRLFGSRSVERAKGTRRSYFDLTEKLYRVISMEAGGATIIDSSKRPTYAAAIRQFDHVESYVVHLVRDSRAVVFSWRRRLLNPDRPDGGYMARYPAWKSALGWAVWNMHGEWFRIRQPERYLLVRYEDFVDRPAAVLQSIADLVHEDLSVDVGSERQVTIDASHAISGNPSKFRIGTIQLRQDTEWVDRMTRTDFWIATVLTWPLLVRYRYRFRRG